MRKNCLPLGLGQGLGLYHVSDVTLTDKNIRLSGKRELGCTRFLKMLDIAIYSL